MSEISVRLHNLMESDWEWEMQDNPEFASQAGQFDIVRKSGIELQSISPSAYARRSQHSKEMVAAVQDILAESENLSPSDLIFAKLFLSVHKEVSDSIDNFPLYLIPLNSIGVGCITYAFSESVEWLRFETIQDFEIYQRKLRAFDRLVDENIECLREGVVRGYVASADMVRDVEAQLSDIISGNLPEFTAPLRTESAATILAGSSLLSELEASVEHVRSGFAKFLTFFRDEYSKALRQSPSCSSLPDGAALYRQCLKFHTTTDMTADEIHDIGLAEVAKIEARYRNEVLIPLGYKPDDFALFVDHARSDERFHVKSSDALLDRYRAITGDIHALLPRFFKQLPRSSLEITTRAVGPSAFYLAGTADGRRPGRFYVNVANLEKRATYECTALALHEGIPGHHLQVSLTAEDHRIPKFLRFVEDRRYEACPCRRNMFSSYVEGWALYCEHLGEEMGVYKTPHDLFGRLSMDMMRAVRLVVDTGLHAKGWGVGRCVEYMMEKTGRHRHEVETEVYRYASWPGQAVAYKIGQLEMLRLRRRAEEALGPRFDLREFHSLILGSGPQPLSLLADMVDDFIAHGGGAAAAAE